MRDITVDTGNVKGEVRPVNGFCNGPTKLTAKYFKKAEIPFSRLHDMRTHFHDICDVPAIFRDFDADENDPASYDFTLSDYYIQNILDCGTGIIYRLGRSMNTGDFRWDNEPPRDFAKWARICEHIIAHYNRGWADGHDFGIKYFEIWNEPDTLNPQRDRDGQWTGTPEQFYEFYSVAATYLKSRFPEYSFGGYASCDITSDGRREFCDGFVKYQSEHNTPLDFMSWHCYTDKADGIRERVAFVRGVLEKYGYNRTSQICTEWNYFWLKPDIWDAFDGDKGEYMFQQLFNEASGIRGAAYSLAAMITFQNEGVAAATLHRADPLSMYCTVFNIYGVPQKQYDAFLCFKELRKLGTAVQADCADEGVYVAAATDGADVVVAISSYFGAPGFRRLNIAGLYEDAVYTLTRRVCDAERSLESVQTQTGIPSELDTGFYCCSPSLTLFTFKMNRGE